MTGDSGTVSSRRLADWIYAREGLVFNCLCGIYFLALAPWVRRVSVDNIHEDGTILPWFGITLLGIMFLEIYALPRKLKFVHGAIRDHGAKASGTAFLLWMFHTVISIILLFSIFQAFGYDITPDEGAEPDTPWWMALTLFAVVIKELYFLFCMWGISGSGDEPVPERYRRPRGRELVLDLVLTVYACLAYTVTWETIASNVSMQRDDLPMYILNLLVSSLLFLLFYLPLRIPYHLEEMAQLKSRRQAALYVAGILAALIPAIAMLR